MANEIDEIISGLKNATIENNPDKVYNALDKIIAEPTNYDNIELTEDFINLLKINNSNNDMCTVISKCIAEITKIEGQRKKFTNNIVIKYLIDFLLPNDNNSVDLIIQASRALGNICFLNEDARNIILTLECDEIIINLLDKQIKKEDASYNQFIKVRSGLISNYLLGGEDIAKRAINFNILSKIENIIKLYIDDVQNNEKLFKNVLPPLNILTENLSDLNFNSNLNILIAKIFASCTDPDLAEMCLEILHYQAENDDVKLLLAKEGLCETIYKLLEKYKTLASTSEARALMKLACDLIVLILTGDDSMHYLYSTPLLKYMEDWLDSYDVDLLTTGVLALGNFARTDSHCIYMVENQVMKKLLSILSKNNGVDDDMRLQHALLSALRNLVIPKPNKPAVIEAGLVETIIPMLEIHQSPVVFKLLGTLRMTVDGQVKLALELLQNRKLIDQLVHWCKSSDSPGVTGESFRLMAWLIKHAYQINKDANVNLSAIDDTSLKAFVDTDSAVESMINMLTSQHVVMQNEALIALSILSTILNRKPTATSENTNEINLDELYIKCDIGQKMSDFITKNSDTMTKEIVENLQTLMKLLKLSDNLIKHLNTYNIDESLKSIPILVEYCTL